MSDPPPSPPPPGPPPLVPQPTPPAQVTAFHAVTADEKNMGLLSHLLTLSGFVIPFGNLIGPLVVYLIKKDDSAYIRHHAVEALNFQISLLIYFLVAFLLCFIFVGFILLPALLVLNILFTVIAAIKASEAQYYRYPMTIRLVS